MLLAHIYFDENCCKKQIVISWLQSCHAFDRNNLVLGVSEDLLSWRVCETLLADDTGLSAVDSARYTGFEYPDFVFSGNDIVATIRTAYRGAVSSGSSNRITFLRVHNYADQCA